MRYFIDTEFAETGSSERPTIDLISIGIVSEDGREYYAESKEFQVSNCNPWVLENVIPKLGDWRWRKSRANIRADIVRFISDEEPQLWGYYCLAPATRILTLDLNWVPIGDIREGDDLLGFDEEGPPGEGRSRCWRQWRPSRVIKTKRLRRPCYQLTFSDGTKVTASSEHSWLAYSGYQAAEWIRTDKLIPNGARTVSQIVKPVDVWETDQSRDAGYLAAALDGEGHFYQRDLRGLTTTSNPVRTFQTRIGFAQKENAMLDEVTRILRDKDIRHRFGANNSGVTTLTIGHRGDILKVLGSIRPVRLLERMNPDGLGAIILKKTVSLVEKQFIGEQEVVAITTDTGTFVAEGLASHNCSYDWVVFCWIFGDMVDLPMSFPRFCMDLRQWWAHLGEPLNIKPDPPIGEHNALADARWNLAFYRALKEYESRETKSI